MSAHLNDRPRKSASTPTADAAAAAGNSAKKDRVVGVGVAHDTPATAARRGTKRTDGNPNPAAAPGATAAWPAATAVAASGQKASAVTAQPSIYSPSAIATPAIAIPARYPSSAGAQTESSFAAQRVTSPSRFVADSDAQESIATVAAAIVRQNPAAAMGHPAPPSAGDHHHAPSSPAIPAQSNTPITVTPAPAPSKPTTKGSSMSKVAEANNAAKNLMRGKAPEQTAMLSRFSILMVIDASGSTSMEHQGNPADNDVINKALPLILKAVREAPRTSPLGKHKDRIDVSILAYSEDVTTILPWTAADKLPNTLPAIVPDKGTHTGHAFEALLNRVSDYQLKLQANKTPVGVTTVLHITDGAPTDMKPGDEIWENTRALMARATGGLSKKASVSLVHFITPNGCDPTFLSNLVATTNGHGNGLERLSQLTGANSVVPLNKGIKMMDDLVKLIVGTVLRATTLRQPASQAALDAVNDVLKSGPNPPPPTDEDPAP